MKRYGYAALAALCCCLLMTGCGTVKKTWRDTKKVYKEYVNTDPTIDMSDEGISDKGLQRLAALFTPVDQRLEVLLRVLSGQDSLPEREWCQQLLANHSWLSGVAVVDTGGIARFQVPSASMRQLDVAPLLDFEERYKKRIVAAAVKTDELGTVVMVAQPYSDKNEWAGLIVAFFDPRNLVAFSSEAGALVIMSTEGPVWSGDSESAASGLSGLKWPEILKGAVQGEINAGGGNYVWQARYLGQMELIYLTDAKPARVKKPAPAKPKAEPEPATPAGESAAKPTPEPGGQPQP